MKPSPAQPAINWLNGQPGFQDLATHSARMARLQADLDRCAAIKGLVVNALTDSVLVITTRNAAVASKLRQREPSLLADLTRSGWKVSRIRIRPQPQRAVDDPPPPAPRPKPALTEAAVAALGSLRDQTPDGALRQALVRMIGRRRGS